MKKNSLVKEVIKNLKKENLIGVRYQPTLEECDYFYEKGINVIHKQSPVHTLVGSFVYMIDTTDFIKEN